ncbi:MAG TPA: O-antigen ligase family protein [Candidatus Saccharimonadales bacterium]|nr:O-antigen ligase family protein [Candidatus Saccharimonadales bacterium]
MASWLLGIWVGLTFCKLGNPVIFEGQTPAPTGILEAIFSSWPISWGYVLLGLVVLATLPLAEWKAKLPKYTIYLLLFWFGWQVFSTAQTTSARLSWLTVPHFGACVVSFFIGALVVSRFSNLAPVWVCLLVGFIFVCWMGIDQHFGGLERTRKEFLQMDWSQFSPELRAKLDTPEFRTKIMSERIFGTFVYANALAGGILLLMPICLWSAWELFKWLSLASRMFILAVVGCLGVGCLYWSGSKAGWLIAIGLVAVAFSMLSLKRQTKWIFMALLILAGTAGFYTKYQGYFAKGATSATARTDYWKAAWETAVARPILGSGPGTFSIEYKKRKSAESEMARLAHNDYLEQASDSGWPGFISYAGFIIVSLTMLYRNALGTWRDKALWLGALGLAAQSVVEFGLYIPALAWPFFLFLGWLWGNHRNRVDIPNQAA